MIVLALDSTTPAGSVGLGLPDGTIHAHRGDGTRPWSERLPADLLALLERHHLGPRDVDLFAVVAGPGSLTGLRVGMATIQGMAFATGRPVVAASALDVLAEAGWYEAQQRGLEDYRVGAWANALRSEVFAALYDRVGAAAVLDDPVRAIAGPIVATPEEASAGWQEVAGSAPRLVVVGDVEGLLGDPLRNTFGARLVEVQRPVLAEVLVLVARRRGARGEATSPHAIHPVYVRKPDAVLARERAQRAAEQAWIDGSRP